MFLIKQIVYKEWEHNKEWKWLKLLSVPDKYWKYRQYNGWYLKSKLHLIGLFEWSIK